MTITYSPLMAFTDMILVHCFYCFVFQTTMCANNNVTVFLSNLDVSSPPNFNNVYHN